MAAGLSDISKPAMPPRGARLLNFRERVEPRGSAAHAIGGGYSMLLSHEPPVEENYPCDWGAVWIEEEVSGSVELKSRPGLRRTVNERRRRRHINCSHTKGVAAVECPLVEAAVATPSGLDLF